MRDLAVFLFVRYVFTLKKREAGVIDVLNLCTGIAEECRRGEEERKDELLMVVAAAALIYLLHIYCCFDWMIHFITFFFVYS